MRNPTPAGARTANDDRDAHLVMKGEWPKALCGEIVSDLFNRSAAGRDRCIDCLRIAKQRGLSLTGWSIKGSPGQP